MFHCAAVSCVSADILFFSCSSVNGESHREVYSYVDQLPVSEIIHQVRVPSRQQAPVTETHTSLFVLCIFWEWTVLVCHCGFSVEANPFILFPFLIVSVSVLVLDLDSEPKVRCIIYQQMSLCRFHSDVSGVKCCCLLVSERRSRHEILMKRWAGPWRRIKHSPDGQNV